MSSDDYATLRNEFFAARSNSKQWKDTVASIVNLYFGCRSAAVLLLWLVPKFIRTEQAARSHQPSQEHVFYLIKHASKEVADYLRLASPFQHQQQQQRHRTTAVFQLPDGLFSAPQWLHAMLWFFVIQTSRSTGRGRRIPNLPGALMAPQFRSVLEAFGAWLIVYLLMWTVRRQRPLTELAHLLRTIVGSVTATLGRLPQLLDTARALVMRQLPEGSSTQQQHQFMGMMGSDRVEQRIQPFGSDLSDPLRVVSGEIAPPIVTRAPAIEAAARAAEARAAQPAPGTRALPRTRNTTTGTRSGRPVKPWERR
eukprot:TRINITY_DN2972_c0_g3_i1.p1 TRINITY_DN2972_c0_g3~~TRINITY_DN2972_c0_g3_i1.p1  ORF type:complete len:310 (+),score=57.04 TRINITY_DN2972_c0_g3_i1:29-958(+)